MVGVIPGKLAEALLVGGDGKRGGESFCSRGETGGCMHRRHCTRLHPGVPGDPTMAEVSPYRALRKERPHPALQHY